MESTLPSHTVHQCLTDLIVIRQSAPVKIEVAQWFLMEEQCAVARY